MNFVLARAGAILVCAATAALADPCYKPANHSCASSGGNAPCGSNAPTVSCTAGWTSTDGCSGNKVVQGWQQVYRTCATWTGCALAPCSMPLPPGQQNIGCAPNSNGQCCICSTMTNISTDMGKMFWIPTATGAACSCETSPPSEQ
jgi:hypothetical protein